VRQRASSRVKKDFPLVCRGYDRVAVDRHLESLWRRLESRDATTVASMAAEHVLTILTAAEVSAADLRSTARARARATTKLAALEAEELRAAARSQAMRHLL
jgi:hypothetical protein